VIRIVVIGLMGVVGAVGCGGGDDQGRDASIGGEGGSGGVGGGGSGGSGGAPECFEVNAAGRDVGGICTGPTLDCKPGLECIVEQSGEPFGTIGGPDNPILNYPPGEDVPIDAPFFLGSYCTLPVAATPTGCDPDACAAECGLCTPIAGEVICMNACLPELDTNSICRPGYRCDLFDFVCFPGCTSNDECRVSRLDTNGNGQLEFWDPETLMGDNLVYNTSSEARCNMETYRCEHEGTPGAEAGSPCTFNDDCEADGVCLFGPDGYCSKFGCDIPGNDCAGGGVCAAGQCLAPCDVGSDDTTPPVNNTQGCREGYTCYWGGADADPSGFCDVGLFNDVTINNIGSACVSADECYSPFGYGRCDPDFGCTVIECGAPRGAPGLPADVCGDNATCVDFINLGVDLFACLKKCVSAEDCFPGDACADVDLDDATVDEVCFPVCLSPDECRIGEDCVNGECVTP